MAENVPLLCVVLLIGVVIVLFARDVLLIWRREVSHGASSLIIFSDTGTIPWCLLPVI